MKNNFRRRRPRTSSQEGQTFISIAVLVAVLLVGMLGVAIDYSQLWAHRQMAQGAADAACQAGAADLYLNAIDPGATVTGLESFSWIPANPDTGSFACSASPNTPPCQYASLNGYPGKFPGSSVNVSFPSKVTNAPPLTGPFAATVPYIKVTVSDPVHMTLTRLFSPNPNVTINATASCGLVPVTLPTPLVVLHSSASGALTVGGSASIIVYGGPQRSVQVNSTSTTAASIGGTVDLSRGGPASPPSGSDFAVFGGPNTQPGGVLTGSTGNYIFPAPPLQDPFAAYNPPDPKTLNLGSARAVPFRVNGCPDPAGCVEFTAGDYTGCSTSNKLQPGDQGCLNLPYQGKPKFKIAAPDWVLNQKYTAGALIQPTSGNGKNFLFIATNSGTAKGEPAAWPQTPCAPQSDGTCLGQTVTDGGGIKWQNVGTVASNLNLTTGIFDPGLYYVDANGLVFGDQSAARVSTAAGDGSDGIMFYFNTSAGTVSVTSNSGKAAACTTADANGTASPAGCIVAYDITGAVSSAATGYLPSQKLQCPNGATNPKPVQDANPLNGNVLLGPCGNVPGNPVISATYGSPDGNRGFLFFQNRATSAQAIWGGGGQFLSSGFMYFHSGNGSSCGTSTSCLKLRGNSGAQSFTLGNIVVDELSSDGTPQINMILNPAALFQVLKPTLLQ
jgi:hypothetical protein